MRHRLHLAAVALAFTSAPAFAGVVVTSMHTAVETNKTDPVMAYFEADRMKIVMPENVIIYRGDLQKFWIVSPAKHNYVEMTPETMKSIAGQMQTVRSAQSQIQQQLAKLPPEQRAAIENQLAKQGIGIPGAPPPQRPPATYVKSGPAKTVASGRCEVYSRMDGQTKGADLCIAPIGSVGLTPADFKVFESFEAFVAPVASSPMAPRSDFLNWNEMNKAIGFQGIPLETTVYSGGKPFQQDTVQKIEHSAIPTAAFELPQGLTRQDLPAIPGVPGGKQ